MLICFGNNSVLFLHQLVVSERVPNIGIPSTSLHRCPSSSEYPVIFLSFRLRFPPPEVLHNKFSRDYYKLISSVVSRFLYNLDHLMREFSLLEPSLKTSIVLYVNNVQWNYIKSININESTLPPIFKEYVSLTLLALKTEEELETSSTITLTLCICFLMM